jgi:speckle-type POZ protein
VNDYALGPAFSSLLETGLYSDVEIEVNGESLFAHKCILTARSEKFNVMLLSESTSEMQERQTNKITIKNKDVNADTFKQMLKWLYMGECEISHNASEVIPLL